MRLPTLLLGFTLAVPALAGLDNLRDDFSRAPLGTLSENYLRERWQARIHTGVPEGRAVMVSERGATPARFVRITYPRGQIGSRDSGAQWVAALEPCDEATVEYRVRFDPQFDWTTGGKLPGLAGGSAPSGGNPRRDGFSARYMWSRGGGIFLYLYHAQQAGRYADGLRFDNARAVPGQWHTLRQRVRLNTPGRDDGLIQVWFDGRMVLDRGGLAFRDEGATWRIDQFFFSTFHGGGSDDYRPARDNTADFADFVVETP
jgi:hypothetical protein